MRTLSLLLAFFLFAGSAYSQENPIPTISINSSATVEIPADQLAFNININAEADTPQEAFELHKEREKVLLELLKKHQIEEENINFEPISISEIRNRSRTGEEERQVRTRQSVSLTISDFDKYEEIQIALIESGYNNFSGNFISTESDSGKDEALKKALDTARQKAELIAGQSGLELTGISSIEFSHDYAPPRPMAQFAVAADRAEESSLISEYAQTVSVSANISVKYYFRETGN